MSQKPKNTSLPRPNDSKYLEFLSALQLVGLGLKSSSTMLDRGMLWELTEKGEKSARQLAEIAESYKTSDIGKDFFEAEGRYSVIIADGNRVALKVECAFEVHMHAQAPIEPAMAARFAKSDLRFVLLPYARYFVTGVTSQMQIPPIVLPLATAAGKARRPNTPSKD